MSFTTTLRQVSAVAVAAGALFAAALPAQGAVIVASFDPLVGPPFPANVSYRGTANFTINDACLAITGIVLNTDACSGGSMFMNSASVTFSDPSGDLDTVSFASGTIAINRVEIAGGEVTGLDTAFANPAVFLSSSYFTGSVALGFRIGIPSTTNIPGGAQLQLDIDDNLPPFLSNVATDITFTRLPEPGTLALVALAAVGAGAATRRRKAA